MGVENYLILTFSRSKRSDVTEIIDLSGVEIKDIYSLDIDYSLPLIQLDFEWYILLQRKVTLSWMIMKNLER